VFGIDLNERHRCDRRLHARRLVLCRDRALSAGSCSAVVADAGTATPRAAVATMLQVADDILQACRADPDRDAPLVHALIAAVDPVTGAALSDRDICNDLLIFISLATTRPPRR